MNRKIVFCEECRSDVDYTVTDALISGRIKGVEYQYPGKEAHCATCGALLYVPEINDMNLHALYDVYRNKNSIVPLSVIKGAFKR